MRQISDRTLSEMLRDRLHAARVFELFVREIEPGEWLASARGFFDDGRVYRVEARDRDLVHVFRALLAQVDAAVEKREAAPIRPYLERIALELAAQRSGVTLRSLTDAIYERGDASAAITRCARILVELVAAGELRQDGAVYRRPIQPTTGAST